jgi:hypothetical protein
LYQVRERRGLLEMLRKPQSARFERRRFGTPPRCHAALKQLRRLKLPRKPQSERLERRRFGTPARREDATWAFRLQDIEQLLHEYPARATTTARQLL